MSIWRAKNKGQPIDKDKTFEELWAKSVAARKFYLSTMATAVEIDSVISEDVQWEWARNDQNQGKLKYLVAEVRNSMSAFQKAFLSEEPSAIRKRYKKGYDLGRAVRLAAEASCEQICRVGQVVAEAEGRLSLIFF